MSPEALPGVSVTAGAFTSKAPETRHTWSTRVSQHPGTYQVVFLALRRVLGVPLLLSAALLEVVVAAAVAVVVA